MSDDDVSDEVELVFTLIASASCLSTVSGWLWYCDAHDTHGNADTEEEAQYVADAHVAYHNDGHEDTWSCDMYVVCKNAEETR